MLTFGDKTEPEKYQARTKLAEPIIRPTPLGILTPNAPSGILTPNADYISAS